MGKADRVLCIVLDGEPMAEDTNGDPEEECLPLAARRKVDDQGNILHEIFEPGAADLRSSGDGEKDAMLKIVAGLLGVGLDEIKQRDIPLGKEDWFGSLDGGFAGHLSDWYGDLRLLPRQ